MKASRGDTVRVHNRIGTVLSTSQTKAKVEFDTGYIQSYEWRLIHKCRTQKSANHSDDADDDDTEIVEKLICLNHKTSVIFPVPPDDEDERCPVCKEYEYVASYSGPKDINWKKVRRHEREQKKEK